MCIEHFTQNYFENIIITKATKDRKIKHYYTDSVLERVEETQECNSGSPLLPFLIKTARLRQPIKYSSFPVIHAITAYYTAKQYIRQKHKSMFNF